MRIISKTSTSLINESHLKDVSINVEVLDTVIARIHGIVTLSDIEEGGKFVGSINRTDDKLLIRVESYIDSGPGVNNSSSHLLPDGAYQETVFRLIEIFDPPIEHLGSWHTHHCNGLDGLSTNDINGYNRSVNNPQYNLDYFFVLLVTGLNPDTLQARYYIFTRGYTSPVELGDNNVRVINGEYFLETVLQETERKALLHRGSLSSYNSLKIESRAVCEGFSKRMHGEDS